MAEQGRRVSPRVKLGLACGMLTLAAAGLLRRLWVWVNQPE